MKKVLGVFLSVFIALSVSMTSADAAKKKVKLEFDETKVERVDKYSFKVSGTADKKATITFNKQKIKLDIDENGHFSETVKLKKKVKKKVKVVAKRKGYKKTKIKLKITDPKKEEKKSKKKTEKKTDYTEANKTIAEHLKEDQGFALGTLDNDGNPTENGTPNDSFAWSLVVTEIKFDDIGDLEVRVTADFESLSDDDKTEIARSCQNIGVLYGGDPDYKKPFTTVYLGENALGHSKILTSTDFTWY